MQTEFGDGRMNLTILVLKADKLSAFLRLGSNFFHPMIVDGKNESLGNFWFLSIMRMFSAFVVEYNVCLIGIKLKRY